jgi:hypothetical protein
LPSAERKRAKALGPLSALRLRDEGAPELAQAADLEQVSISAAAEIIATASRIKRERKGGKADRASCTGSHACIEHFEDLVKSAGMNPSRLANPVLVTVKIAVGVGVLSKRHYTSSCGLANEFFRCAVFFIFLKATRFGVHDGMSGFFT